ncbi:MAG: hypothetical protein KA004_11385 [Verrucomicrobiales bacterium]|nr:hypothetical protein [Verrucomicrobiales bacterium]
MDHLTIPHLLGMALLAAAVFLSAIAAWVATQALFPNFIRSAQQHYARPWRALALGAAVVLPIAGLCWWLWRHCHCTGISALVLGSLLLLLCLAGSAGLARRIGSGMMHPTDKDQPWRRTLRGGSVLACLLVPPVIQCVTGFFILTTGAGVAVLTLLEARRRQRETDDDLSDTADEE